MSNYNISFRDAPTWTPKPDPLDITAPENQSWIDWATSYFSTKEVSLISPSWKMDLLITSEKGEVVFSREIDVLYGYNIAIETDLSKRLIIPLKVGDNPKDIVFVRVDKLIEQLGLRPNIKEILQRIGGGAYPEEMKGAQVKSRLELTLVTQALDDKQLKTYQEAANAPIEETVHQQTEQFLETFVPLSSEELNRLVENPVCVDLRTNGSNSLTADSPFLQRKLDNWKRADAMARELALSKTPLTFEHLCEFNRILYDGIEEEDVVYGALRTDTVFAGDSMVSYLPLKKIEQELKDTIQMINTQMTQLDSSTAGTANKNIIEIAASAYQRIVSIHPFPDGNGRTSRLVMDYILQSAGLPPATLGENPLVGIFGEQREDISHLTHTPTDAVLLTLAGVRKSMEIIAANHTISH